MKYELRTPDLDYDLGRLMDYTLDTMDKDEFNSIIYELNNILKEKGLTIRQAQFILDCTKDYVLNSTMSF